MAAGPDSDPDGPSPVSEDAASKVWLEPERSMPSDAVIKLKSLEAFAAAADGRATKIIIPSEIQGAAALAAGLVESVKGGAPNA